ncbi:Gei-8p, partial [Spiromyces aspiralis]
MVLDHQERVALQFNNENHKVEDPPAFYHVILPDSDPVQQQQPPTRPPAPRRRNSSLKVGDGIPASIVSEMTGPDVPAHGPLFNNNSDPDNIWTNEEKDIFVREYLQHPKQFGKIALALPFKNPRECVLFYYRNKKSLNLKHLMLKQARKARRNRKMSTKKRKEKAKERREQERRARDAQAQRARCSSVGADGSDVDAYATVQPDELAVSDEETFLTHGKGGALLRSIIAANKKRKHQVLPYLSGMGIPHVSPSLVYPDEEENEDARSRGASSVDTPLAPLSSRRSRSPEPDENSVVGVLRSTGRRISVDATDSEDYSVNITAYQSEESDVGREDPPVLSTYPPLKPQQRRISKPPGLALVEQVPDAANNGELEERAEAEEGEEEEEGEMVGDEREKGQSPKTQSTSYLRREEFDNIAEREMIIPCTGTNKLEARDGSVPAEDALDKHLDPGTPLPAFIAKLNGDASSGKGLADSSAPIADASSHAPNLSWESKAGGPLRVDASAVYASVEEQIARAIGTEPVVFVGAAKWKRDERARAIKAL